MSNTIKLLPTSILNVPIQKFDNDFIFIVNEEKYITNRIIADLISPQISQSHFTDPTLSQYTINTDQKGNFQFILDLVNFQSNTIPESEIPFIEEILFILGNKSIEIDNTDTFTEMTLDLALEQIESHEKHENFYSKLIEKDINFISSHFYQIDEDQIKIIGNLKLETIEKIIKNPNLRLESEDQLLTILNHLYQKNSIYSILYENINFLNVTTSKISEFLMMFDTFDLTRELWISLSMRLQHPLSDDDKIDKARYYIQFSYNESKKFDGIINYLHMKYKREIFNHINITSSSIYDTDQKDFSPSRTIYYDTLDFFKSKNEENSWICFDFKNYHVIPSGYSIRSPNMSEIGGFLKNWVIEGCNDLNDEWTVIDEQVDCKFLIGRRYDHSFEIQNPKKEKFRFLRLRQKGPSFNGNNNLNIESIEFFGGLL